MKLLRIALTAIYFVCPSALAWGNEGHRISGYIASALLTESARAQLRELVGTDDLAGIATLLDDERDALEQRAPGSSRWHYENRQVCAYPSSKPQCPNGQCVTRQIALFTRIAGDAGADRHSRSEAIQGLTHLLGDLHQPLHLSDNNDRGGNDVRVRLPGEKKPRNLHEAWDTRFVRMNVGRRDERRYAASLLERYSDRHSLWMQGDVQTWATETFTLADEHAYRALPHFACGSRQETIELTAPYVEQARALIEEQIAKSGARLAHVLNQALSR